ncbi:MAG: hypothetical protein WCU88_03530 [Elusimicrobiota bacterium]
MSDAERLRFLVYTTVFGALWGLAEALLGGALHAARFPLRGAVMAAMGSIILCAVRVKLARPGAALAAGATAAALKLVSIGAFKLGPTVGILVESLLVELVLSLFGTSPAAILLACITACLEGIPHFFITNRILYGRDIFTTYLAVVRQMQAFFGLPEDAWKTLLGLWLAGHLLIGACAGAVAVMAARRLRDPHSSPLRGRSESRRDSFPSGKCA